jgi:hypothetical protein
MNRAEISGDRHRRCFRCYAIRLRHCYRRCRRRKDGWTIRLRSMDGWEKAEPDAGCRQRVSARTDLQGGWNWLVALFRPEPSRRRHRPVAGGPRSLDLGRYKSVVPPPEQPAAPRARQSQPGHSGLAQAALQASQPVTG